MMMSNDEEIKLSREEIEEELWQRGELRWKLHPVQKRMYNSINDYEDQTVVISCARRLGKTFLMCVLALEQCIKVPKSIVKFVAPQQKQVKKNIKPIMNMILNDCPKTVRPMYKTNDNIYLFPNGSEIQLAGTDNGNHESIRGGYSHLNIVDEAGFCDELEYLINSILQPTTDTTDGKTILVSTPSISMDHDFIVHYIKPFDNIGKLIKYTIYDNPMMDAKKLERILSRYPDREKSIVFRREYMCELIADEERIVVPEFTRELESEIVREWQRPPFFDCYVSMDIGFKDLTAVLFAYYDFKNGKIIIEDEVVMSGPSMTTDKLAATIKAKEKQLWSSPLGDQKKPSIRVSDNNLIMINDLSSLHGLHFSPTAKDQAIAALNNMRIYLNTKKVIINPRCVNLIKHLRGATWNKKRTDYDRSPDSGHYDFVDSLSYLLRNIGWSKNPYPANHGIGHDWFIDEQVVNKNSNHNVFKKMLNIKN